MRVCQLKAERMQPLHLGNAFRITGCSPNFVTLSNERLRNSQANTRAGAGQKNAFHGRALSHYLLSSANSPADELSAGQLHSDVGIHFLNDGKITDYAGADQRRLWRIAADFIDCVFCNRESEVPVKKIE